MARNDRTRSPMQGLPRRSSSMGSDRGRASTSILQPAPIVSPPPAYVALSAASQAATDANVARLDDDDEVDIDGSDAASVASAERQQALFTPGALTMINAFLDQILYASLATAKGTTLSAIRPATEQVLKGKLAREAFAATEEELEDLLVGAQEEDEQQDQSAAADASSFDLDLAWKRSRLRIMVYTRLGEMEDDDEEHFVRETKLYDAKDGAKAVAPDAGLMSWAAAIFMTSILEFIAEQCIFIAGGAAYDRVSSRTPGGVESPASDGQDSKHVKILEHDVEKIALNPTLNRLWRTWRKGLRQSRSLAINSASNQKWSSSKYSSHKKSRSEPLKAPESAPPPTKRQHSFASSLNGQPDDAGTPRRRRSLADLVIAQPGSRSASTKVKRRRSWPSHNAKLLTATTALRGFRTNPPATIGPKLGHFRTSRSTDSPIASSPVTPSSSRHSLPRDPKPLTPRVSGETNRGPRELKLASRQRSARSSMDSPVTSPMLHSETKRLSDQKPPSVPEEPVSEESTPSEESTVAASHPAGVNGAITAAAAAASLERAVVQPSQKQMVKDTMATSKAHAPDAALQKQPSRALPPVSQTSAAPSELQKATKPVAAPAATAAVAAATSAAATTNIGRVRTQRQTSVTDTAAVAPIAPATAAGAQSSEDTAVPAKLANLPRLSTQSAGSRWSNNSGGSEKPYASKFVEGSPTLDTVPDLHATSAYSPPSKSSRKHDSMAADGAVQDIPSRTMSKKNYVDDQASERASVQRLSTSSSVRLSKTMGDQYRARDNSSGSFAGKGRDGAESRQSFTSSAAHSEAMERDFDELISGTEPVKYTLTPRTLRNLESPSETTASSAGPQSSKYQVTQVGGGTRASAGSSNTKAANASKSSTASFSAHMAARDVGLGLTPVEEPSAVEADRIFQPLPESGRPKRASAGMARDARIDLTSTREMSDFLRSTQPPSAARAPLAPIGEAAVNRYVSAPTSTRVSRRPSLTKLDAERPKSNGKAEAGLYSNSSSVKKMQYVPRDPVARRSDHHELISFLREGPSSRARGANGSQASEGRHSATTSFSHTDSINSQSRLINQPIAAPRKQTRVKDMYSTDFVDEDDEDLILGFGSSNNRSTNEESLMEFLKSTPPPVNNASPTVISGAQTERYQPLARDDTSSTPRAKKGWFSRSSSREQVAQTKSSTEVSSTPPMLPMPGYFGANDAGNNNFESKDGVISTTSAAAAPGANRGKDARMAIGKKESIDKKRPFWRRIGAAN